MRDRCTSSIPHFRFYTYIRQVELSFTAQSDIRAISYLLLCNVTFCNSILYACSQQSVTGAEFEGMLKNPRKTTPTYQLSAYHDGGTYIYLRIFIIILKGIYNKIGKKLAGFDSSP